MTRKLLFVYLITASFASRGQEIILTLPDALDAAIANNRELSLAKLEEESAHARFKQTQAIFLPQISISYAAVSTNNPLNAFGFKLQQQSITQNDFNPELLNHPSATQNFMTKAEWQQPIINMDMLYARQAAAQQSDVFAFKRLRTKQYLTFEVEKAYAQVRLAQQAQQVLQDALETTKAISKATQDHFDKGYLQKSDVLQVQVQVAAIEHQLAEASSNMQNASDYLGLLMGNSPGATYRVDTTTALSSSVDATTTVPMNRADFLAMQSAVDAHDKMIQSGKMTYVPKLNAFAEYLINDREALGFGSDAYLVGAQLSWTIFNGSATRHKIAEYRTERNKAEVQLAYQKDQAQLELIKTLRQREDALAMISAQNLSIQQAKEALRILQNRHAQGLVTTTELLQAQTSLAQQRLSWAQAVFAYNTANAYANFLTTTSDK